MGRTTVPVNLRVKPELREQIEAAAAAGGRSLTQEIVERLERSFDEAQQLDPVFANTRLHALMALAAIAMERAGVQTYVAANTRLYGPACWEQATQWIDDPLSFSEAIIAANRIFNDAAPEQAATKPPEFPDMGRSFAGSVEADLLSAEPAHGEPAGRAEWLRNSLGSIVDRIRSRVSERASERMREITAALSDQGR